MTCREAAIPTTSTDAAVRYVVLGTVLVEPLLLALRRVAEEFVSGDRYASIRDPFGVRWSIMSRVEDLSDEESSRRVAEWAASFSAAPSDDES